MRHKTCILLLTALLLPAHQSVSGQKIYLAPAGDDSNPGTIDKPLASLPGACEMARKYRESGNIEGALEIIALSGEYFMMQPLFLTPADGGSTSSPLIIRSENGGRAVFRGGVNISGFQKVNENLWKAFIPQVAYYNSYFEQLYVNGKRAVRARTPNEGFYFVKDVTETILEKGEGRAPVLAAQKISLNTEDARCFESFSREDYQDALMIFYHNWDNTRKRVKEFISNDNAVYIFGEGMKPWNPINSKSRFLIENYRSALDAPGEWFLDREGYLWYIPVEEETIETSTFFAPIIKEFIVIKGDPESGQRVENIHFKDITFEVAGYVTPPEGNEPAQAAAPIDAVITLDFTKNINFSDCEIAHTGMYALWFRRACANCSVSGCYLHDLGAGGVKIGETVIRQKQEEITNNITVDNNIIRNGGHVFPCAVGIIIFNASDNKLTHNEIADFRYTGISAGWVWGYSHSPSKRNRIEFNHIHHLGWGELCDMGGVYTLGASEGTTVSNNLVHHIYSFDYGGWGLYTDEGSYGITMENNLVYLCKNSGFHQHYGKENVIRNNIFACNIRSQLQATRIEEHRSLSFTNNIIFFDRGTLSSSNWHKFNLLSDHNLYWDTRNRNIIFADITFADWQKSGRDVHSVIADPHFLDPGSFDFRFKNLSGARRIKFKPFDYTEAGVYGSEEWKKLAVFDPELAAKFNDIIAGK